MDKEHTRMVLPLYDGLYYYDKKIQTKHIFSISHFVISRKHYQKSTRHERIKMVYYIDNNKLLHIPYTSPHDAASFSCSRISDVLSSVTRYSSCASFLACLMLLRRITYVCASSSISLVIMSCQAKLQ